MKKLVIISFLAVSFLAIFAFWSITSKGYDRQNKYILFIKKIIPSTITKKVRDTVFYIPNLKKKNAELNLQVQKYDQGLSGKIFKKERVESSQNNQFFVKEFFLPFPRLDMRLGWAATENSKRAHYLEIVNDKVLVISGIGQTIYFDKKNINTQQLNQVIIPNNLKKLLDSNKYKLIGIRDLFVNDGFVYISLQHKDDKGFTINIYRARLNFSKLFFEQFFLTKEYWSEYNVFSGGRIEDYKDNQILFSIGYSNVKDVAQNENSLLGKIISIDKTTSDYKLVSLGHRNPQGLFYNKKNNLIINTEHGPKGGDEINLNFHKDKNLPNYGWDIASYGSPYVGKDKFKKSHAKYGFKEPFKNYTPSIGISEIVYLNKEQNPFNLNNSFFVSSLRAGSIYIIEVNDKISKIISEDRVYFKEQRIRDIEFDHEQKVFFILFEYTPSIGIVSFAP